MADDIRRGSGNTGLAFVLGAVVVALAVLGWYVFAGGAPRDEPDLRIQLPGGAAIEGEVTEGGSGN